MKAALFSFHNIDLNIQNFYLKEHGGVKIHVKTALHWIKKDFEVMKPEQRIILIEQETDINKEIIRTMLVNMVLGSILYDLKKKNLTKKTHA